MSNQEKENPATVQDGRVNDTNKNIVVNKENSSSNQQEKQGISYFKNCYATEPEKLISISELIVEIKNPAPETVRLIKNIRLISDIDQKKKLKKQLPAVTISCSCNPRNQDSVISITGFIQYDLDGLTPEQCQEFRKKLVQLPPVAAVFTSPSGYLKAIVAVNYSDVQDHDRAFKTVNQYMPDHELPASDQSVGDCVHLCSVSLDPEAYYNQNYIPLELIPEEPKDDNLDINKCELVTPPASFGDLRPGDDYNNRINFLQVLLRDEWSTISKADNKIYLCRPGKKNGVSASLHLDSKILYNFSSNAPVPPLKAFTPFTYLAETQYGGDYSACAKALKKDGYGENKYGKLIQQHPVDNLITGKAQDKPVKKEDNKKLKIVIKGRLISELRNEICEILTNENAFFVYSGQIMYISELKIKDRNGLDYCFTGFKKVKPAGFVADIESYLNPGQLDSDGNFISKSINESMARQILDSAETSKLLPHIKGISEIKLPYLSQNELKFTELGFDENVRMWTEKNAPEIKAMSLPEAKQILEDLFSEFCFLEPELDLSKAITYLLTPMLKLMMDGQRAMIFFASANRVGAGKDYLLGICPLLYTGIEYSGNPPCNSDDEYRKQIHAACASGARFLTYSNVKGHLSSQALEQAATAQVLGGRTLQKSELTNCPNLALYAISGNGLSVSPDLERRMFEIRLEYYGEDINARKFTLDLYQYIRQNRSEILSALYTLVVQWVANGAEPGDVQIASFATWSKLISGIMQQCGYLCPFSERTTQTASLQQSGNQEDKDLKKLVEIWFATYETREVQAKELRPLCLENDLFSCWDLEQRAGQNKFSRLLRSTYKRVYSGYKIMTNAEHKVNRFRLIKDNSSENQSN